MSKIVPFLLGVATGAGLTYVLDPQLGATRRHLARDQVRSAASGARDSVSGTLDHATDRLTGAVADALPDAKPENDATVVAKVRSEVLGKGPWSDAHLNVDAADGVVTLRGELPSADVCDDLVEAVGKVTGVDEVRSLLHLPGEEAPNVAEARRASPA